MAARLGCRGPVDDVVLPPHPAASGSRSQGPSHSASAAISGGSRHKGPAASEYEEEEGDFNVFEDEKAKEEQDMEGPEEIGPSQLADAPSGSQVS